MDFNKLNSIFETGTKEELNAFVLENNLEIVDGKVKHKDKKEVKKQIEYWDKIQLIKKINLNSLYGALLNPGCRFFDLRLGQSTTLTGRTITKHMNSYINECITGKYDYDGDAIVYSDTDSSYFSAWPMIKNDVENNKLNWSKESCIELYDSIAAQANESFPAFLEKAFHCPLEFGSIIKAGRELIATKGLYITKKRYAVMIFDKESKRQDKDGKPGKIKAMGLDLKRSDTPKFVQVFLLDILYDVLTDHTKEEILEKIAVFRKEFREKLPWEKGTPKRVNNLTHYGNLKKTSRKKVMIPGHVSAALAWNSLKEMHHDNYSQKITDGQKTIVCKLKDNPMGYKAVAYPIDESHLPDWFKELPFNEDEMENVVLNQKITNLLGVLEWELEKTFVARNTFNQLFK